MAWGNWPFHKETTAWQVKRPVTIHRRIVELMVDIPLIEFKKSQILAPNLGGQLNELLVPIGLPDKLHGSRNEFSR